MQHQQKLAENVWRTQSVKRMWKKKHNIKCYCSNNIICFILGQSQGIEPIWSNIYVKDIAKMKNQQLKTLF